MLQSIISNTVLIVLQLAVLTGAAVSGWMLRGVIERVIASEARVRARTSALERYAARARRPIRVRHHAAR